MRKHILFGLHSVSATGLIALLWIAGCGGDNSTGPSGGAGGASGGMTGSGGAVAANICTHTVPPNEQITDYSTYKADGTWGDSTSLTGGAFYYDSTPDDNLAMLTGTLTDAAFNITGDVSAYAGYGLWFGPCLDVSQYLGVTFTVQGTMGNAELMLQVQSSLNYPTSTDGSKGECTGTWTDGCKSNEKVIPTDTLSPDMSMKVDVLWEELTGGQPISPIDAKEILGLQWQFNCAEGATCTPNVIFDNVAFIKAP